MPKPFLYTLACLLLVVTANVGTADDDAESNAIDFVKQIQPILKAHCYECHGTETREAGLRLDRKADALAGGDNGKVFVPESADQSLLDRTGQR